MSKRMKETWPSDLVTLGRALGRWYSVPLVLVAWEILSRTGTISTRLMPSLVEIAAAVWSALAAGDLQFHAGISLGRACLGYALAAVFGVLLGVALARSRTFDALVEPIFSFGYPVPKIALYPVFIFVFGLGSLSKVMLIFLECLYPITLNAFYGMRSVERAHVWAARNMGASEVQVFWRVLLPSSAPSVFAGLRIALPVAASSAMLSEGANIRLYAVAPSVPAPIEKIYTGTSGMPTTPRNRWYATTSSVAASTAVRVTSGTSK